MLKDKTDEFLGARLVADARLHLGAIMNNQYSEPFFTTMCRIIHYKTYLGYKTFTGKEIKLSGIKDFLYNSSYGLGLRPSTIHQFCANTCRLSLKDKTQTRNAVRFVDWLRTQDDKFVFPLEVFEYRRVRAQIDLATRADRKERWRQLKIAQKIYDNNPEIFFEIGEEKKYKNVVDCADALGLEKKPYIIRSNLYNNPTERNLQLFSKAIARVLTQEQQKVLIVNMIENCKLRQERKCQ